MKKLALISDKPVSLIVSFYTPGKAIALVKGYEKGKSNRVYFDRKYGSEKEPLSGKFTLEFPFPFLFEKLALQVENGIVGQPKISIEKMEPKLLQARTLGELEAKQATKDFIKFAQEFSLKVGNIPLKTYGDDTGKFAISYLPVIRDHKTNAVIDTPARVNHVTGLIEVSKKDFEKMTVPNRFFILMHEYVHYANNTKDESECDMLAAKTCMEMGYSAIECFYALSKVFLYGSSQQPTLRKEQEERVAKVKDFINKSQIKKAA